MTDRPRLLEPSRLEPVEVDLRKVFWTGIALWALGGVLAVVLLGTGRTTADAVWVCATGVALGFLALAWESRRRRRG